MTSKGIESRKIKDSLSLTSFFKMLVLKNTASYEELEGIIKTQEYLNNLLRNINSTLERIKQIGQKFPGEESHLLHQKACWCTEFNSRMVIPFRDCCLKYLKSHPENIAKVVTFIIDLKMQENKYGLNEINDLYVRLNKTNDRATVVAELIFKIVFI